MATNRNDTFGYRRGARGVDSDNKGKYEGSNDFKMPKSDCTFGNESDYGAGPVSHRLASLVEDGAANGDLGDSLKSSMWQPGKLKGKDVGGTSPYKDAPTGYYDTHPVKANSPSGKYAKKGGSGQRSGS